MTNPDGNPVLQAGCIRFQVYSGAYTGNWSGFTPPTGEEGLTVMVHNTSDGSVRKYSFVGGGWRYTDYQDV